MLPLVILSASEQVAAHLRTALVNRIWSGMMPGGDRLAAELGVGRDTVEAALKQLENEGFLVNQGRRRGRLIALPINGNTSKRLRLAILLDEESNRRLDYVVSLMHELEQAGHVVTTPPRAMSELGMDVKRIAAMAKNVEADAWMILGGSREVLEWFAMRDAPVFAIFGRRRSLGIAGVGPDKVTALKKVVDALTSLGHRRIVLITKKRRLSPSPGHFEVSFLDFLTAHGITPGSYHMPEWEESIDGLHQRLESLFKLTPPTALIIDEAPVFVATQHFLARRGLAVPEHVSLVCTDADPAFDWCKPPVSHIRWNSRPVVRRILQWAANLSRGRSDLRQTLTPAEFVRGGTIGPAKRDAG
jgi:DNA-binding LacI/PurR family transcriptional regulator/biotin operon repressor